MAEPRVRPATAADIETIARFQERMALATEGKRLDAGKIRAGVRAGMLESDRGVYWIAELDCQPVGSLFVTREWSDWRNGWFWWIQSVFVSDAARRRGVYRALHDAVREEARQAGSVVGVRLYVDKENETAQQTYRALGMRETGYRLFEDEF